MNSAGETMPRSGCRQRNNASQPVTSSLREIEQRLVVEFEAVVGHCLPKILLHGKARLGAGIHVRLEEAMGAAPFGLGGIHCKVGVLDQLIELGAVLRRQRNADAGVGRQLMAEALAGLADRVINSRHEFHDLGTAAGVGLDHGEFVAAEPGDEIGRPEAILDAGSDGLQQFVADMVAERIVDALEFVDVDVEQRELFAVGCLFKLAFDLFAEQHPVGQVGQRVVMREMGDLFIGAAALGDVLDDVDDVARLARGIADARAAWK